MNYELLLVANADRADQLLSRVEKSLKEASASGVRVDRLGKKQLAYSINKQKDAVYFVLNFELAGEAVKPIWDKLRLEQEDLLRYLVLNKKEKKAKGKRGKVSSPFVKTTGDKQVSQEEGEKPKVTVAVKKVSTVKSEEKKVSVKKSTRSASGAGRAKSMKSTGIKKGKK